MLGAQGSLYGGGYSRVEREEGSGLSFEEL